MRLLLFFLILINLLNLNAQKLRARDYDIEIGILKTGENNAITDVTGVKVGHVTLRSGDSINTGVTAILPYDGNIFQNKVPAAIFIGNGFGKLTGYPQVEELGNIETPIILTNTGPVAEGNVGAGTGTSCLGFKGGIGTSSRKIPETEYASLAAEALYGLGEKNAAIKAYINILRDTVNFNMTDRNFALNSIDAINDNSSALVEAVQKLYNEQSEGVTGFVRYNFYDVLMSEYLLKK